MWNWTQGTGPRSAINPFYFKGYDNMKLKNKEALNAMKTLLEKYKIFEAKPCGGDNCDKLFAIALQSDQWSISEGYSNEEIVDLLLKYGAKPNQKSIKDIKRVYDYLPQEEKKNYKYIAALLKR